MPSRATLDMLARAPALRTMTQRLSRRHFAPLADAPKIQGRVGEMRRLVRRAWTHRVDPYNDEANNWLMRTMARQSRNPHVTAVHAYEDCSLLQFQAAKTLGKACIYSMPVAYF